MRGTTALHALGWGTAALALGLLSIFAMSGELRMPRQVVASAGQTAEPLFGLSYRSATAALKACEEHLARPATRVLPTAEWRAVVEGCRAQAYLISGRWPTDARAQLLVAATSFDLDERQAFADALGRSQRLAPSVQWLAERRLVLAGKAEELGTYSYAADVAALLESDAGARVLARQWLAGDAARRARLESAAAEVDPALQQRLLDRIRELVAASGQK